MSTLSVYGATLVGTIAAMLLLWAVSVARRDASIVDIYWGVGFAQIALIACALAGGYRGRRVLITVLVTIWGLRLARYLFWRNRGRGEDYRYQAMRRRHGDRFALVSLYLVFGLQAGLMWIVSLPVQVAEISPVPPSLTWLDAAGTLLWAIGLGFESIGDWQLSRFKTDPRNAGQVMDRGLWSYTRHPNYFGDALVWWGLFCIALSTPHGDWTVISPVVMTIFLMRISGVALLERKLVRSRPGYHEYMRRTNAFFPWFARD